MAYTVIEYDELESLVSEGCLYEPGAGGWKAVWCWATESDQYAGPSDSVLDFGEDRYFAIPKIVLDLILQENTRVYDPVALTPGVVYRSPA